MKNLLRKGRDWLVGFWPKGGFYALTALCLACVAALVLAARHRAGTVNPAPPAPSPAVVNRSMDESIQQVQPASPLAWPVSWRDILTPRSPQELVWWEALGAYQVHEGIDIAAVKGEAVLAAMDGRVTAAYEDPLLGYTVELTHQQNILTRYANLSTLRQVQVGQQVRRGEAIGAVGDSAAAESAMASHLHFEAYRNGEWLDLP